MGNAPYVPVRSHPRPIANKASRLQDGPLHGQRDLFEPYIDDYDRNGHLFRNHIYFLATRDRPVPDAHVAIYPFKRLFVVSAVSTDVQSGQATMCYLPGIETPECECWYINMGAVDKSFFTTDALVQAAIR